MILDDEQRWRSCLVRLEDIGVSMIRFPQPGSIARLGSSMAEMGMQKAIC